MKRFLICLLAVALVTPLLPGCMSRAIKEGVGVVRGAKGMYAPVAPASTPAEAKILGEYKRFELGAITDDFGGQVPSQLLQQLPANFAEQITEARLPNDPSGKTLSIRGRILHYEAQGMLGLAFGDFEEVIARIDFVDKASGRVVGTANCIGRTTESVNRGVASKADGLAKAIVSWIADRYPTE